MFTGLIETTGTIKKITNRDNYLVFDIEAKFDDDKHKIGDSVACDGSCLTIVSFDRQKFTVEVSQETIDKTIAANYKVGSKLNLERPLKIGNRLGGHFVSGHIDDTGLITDLKVIGASVELSLTFDKKFEKLVVDKGSITINGVSLTVNSVTENRLTVNLIPHTLESTNLQNLKANDKVNLEFDIIGKYAVKAQESSNSDKQALAKLSEGGW
ncbi:MAG: riboflavin synthase [candidate division Zixibacteria bacterium]|nr:riboflavin synthase [candidate division Zixibacteria bacterium]